MNDEIWTQLRYWLNLPTTATQGDIMTELEKLLAQLREMAGVAANADQTNTLAALKARVTAGDGLRTAVCKALDVKPDATDDSIASGIATLKTAHAAASAKSDPQVEILSSRLKATTDELASLKSTIDTQAAEGRIKAALSAGQLTEEQIAEGSKHRDFYQKLSRDSAGWEAFMANIPAKAPADGRVLKDSATAARGAEGGRPGVINAATREFDQSKGIACTRVEYVNEVLREKAMAKLSKDEAEKLPA